MASAQAMPPPPPPPSPPSPPVSETAVQPIPPASPPMVPTLAPPSAAQPGPTMPQGGPGYPSAGVPPGMILGPSRLTYSETEPVPPGYEIQTRPRMGMAKAGLAVFIPLYGLSALYGGVYLGSEKGDSQKYGAMVIPVIGPFVTMGTAGANEGTLFLLLDGIGQLTGAALFFAGMVSEEKYLARQTAGLNLRPEVFISPKSVAMRWQF